MGNRVYILLRHLSGYVDKLVLCALLIASLQCSAATSCKEGDLESFKAAWKTFLDKSINDTPEKIADLYKFPLIVTEGEQFGTEVQISRESFIKNYDLIFRHQLKGVDENSSLIDQFKRVPELGKMYDFDSQGCSRLGETGWYGIEFQWTIDPEVMHLN